MISGMRAYGVAVTVIWAMCAGTVLAVLAVTVSGTWLHLGFAAAAVLELALSALTLRFLSRGSVRGRCDVWPRSRSRPRRVRRDPRRRSARGRAAAPPPLRDRVRPR